jgi:Protein of unknown function (DUF3108)
MFAVFAPALVLVLSSQARPPCLPVETGALVPPEEPPVIEPAPAPPPAPAAPAAPAVRRLPPPPPPVRPAPAPVAKDEHTRYRIDYGMLNIGALELTIGGAHGDMLVHAGGTGEGAILGIGHMRNRIDAEFDLQRLDSRSWVNARSDGDRAFRDRGQQTKQGQVDLVRERAGQAPDRTQATLAGPLLDPIGFLLRLRVSPPTPGGPPQVLYVLDGQALWRVTVTSAGRAPFPEPTLRVPTLRLQAEAEPIRYDGVPENDGDRRHRSFALWLSDDDARVPLRLEMPIGIGALVVALTEIERR